MVGLITSSHILFGVVATAVCARGGEPDSRLSEGKCLSDTLQFPPSAKSCQEFQSEKSAKTRFEYSVDGTKCISDLRSGKSCIDKADAYSMKANCEANGLVLCSVEHYKDENLFDFTPKNCKGSTIRKNQRWTSTPCEMTDGTASYISVALGEGKKPSTYSCSNPTSDELYGACCGQTAVPSENPGEPAPEPESTCYSCPANSNLVKEDVAHPFCFCVIGYEQYVDEETGELSCVPTEDVTVELFTCGANQYGIQPSVVACSDVGLPYTALDFGEETDRNQTSCAIHPETSRRGDFCPLREREKRIKYSDASSVCSSIGARLCTIRELEAMPRTWDDQNMCKSEEALVWSNEKCTLSHSTKQFRWALDMKRTASAPYPRVCLNEESIRSDGKFTGFRCCADEFNATLPEAVCVDCPVGAVAPEGAESIEECTCPEGRQLADGGCGLELPEPESCPRDARKDIYTINEKSMLSCETLQNMYPQQWMSPTKKGLCVTVFNEFGKCLPRVDIEQARNTCRSYGARLCTKPEVKKLNVKSVAPLCRNLNVRTSTECCDSFWGANSCDESKGHFLVSAKTGKDQRCSPIEEETRFACCADEKVEQCEGECPRFSKTSMPGPNHIEDCVCSAPRYMDNGKCNFFSQTTCKVNRYLGSRASATHFGLKKQRNKKLRLSAATTKIPGQECENLESVTFRDAQSICENAGMRLCENANEIRRGLFDEQDVCLHKNFLLSWTSKRCDENSFWVSNGEDSLDECVERSSSAGVICCADDKAASCLKCPKGMQTVKEGSTYLSECACKTYKTIQPKHSSNSALCA